MFIFVSSRVRFIWGAEQFIMLSPEAQIHFDRVRRNNDILDSWGKNIHVQLGIYPAWLGTKHMH